MDIAEWDSVFQFVAEPLDASASSPVRSTNENMRIGATIRTQNPTPPDSTSSMGGDDLQEVGETLVSVSTTFYPGADTDSLPPDLVFLSSDSVFFYVHSHILLSSSHNGFKSMLPVPPAKEKGELANVLPVPESSPVFNIILHTIYDMSCVHYNPTFETLVETIEALPAYGISPKARITPASPMFALLASHAPLVPLELYALASRFDLYELAVTTSPHLLSFSLPTLSDEMANRIGPIYLKRLFFLHFGRSDALKRILLPPPHPHGPTPWCDFVEQKKLTRAWALASAYLAWDARPDLPTSTIESALTPLAEHLTCDLCRRSLKERINNLVVQWSIVKRTI